jgi:uncharacterized protein (DUF1501 family)
MTISRRDILKATIASGAFACGLPRLAFGDQQHGLFVLVFLRGACDGLNLVGPAGTREYAEARPPELRVLDSGDRAGIALANGLAGGDDFRLHHDAGGLGELYAAGRLAIVHATGLTTANRSHFAAQDMMDRGVARDAELGAVGTGWLARAVRAAGLDSVLPVIATSPAASPALAGEGRALAVPDVAGAAGLYGGEQTRAVLARLTEGAHDPFSEATRRLLSATAVIDRRIERGGDGRPAPYANAARYDNSGESGRVLQTVARLAKMDVGLSVAAVDIGGWDTHEGQPGRFVNLAGQLSRGLAAFWNDIAALQARTTVVVMTEFGRRFRANRSNGTDHGRAGVMLLLGGRVAGGRMYGQWPGLTSQQLEQGLDLAVTTDYRAVLAEALGGWGLADTQAVFPGYARPQVLGVVG